MAQITGMVKDKETGQVTLLLDSGESLIVDPKQAEAFTPGSVLSEDQLDTLEQSETLVQAYQRAVNLITFRPRSRKEVRRVLEQKTQLSAPEIDLVLRRLEARKWLSDLEFAKWWVDARLTHRPRGRFVLEQELLQKGIEREVITQVLGELAPRERQKEAISRLLDKKLSLWKHLPSKDLRAKLINFFLRRGFEYTDVVDLVDEKLSVEVK